MEKRELYMSCFIIPTTVILLSFAYLNYELSKSEIIVEVAQVQFDFDS